MALTKLPKDGLATDSVSTSQIEDGTIQNTEFADSTLTSAKLTNSTIANAKLSNSSFTINGTSVNLGASITAEAVVDWQSVITSNTTMVKNRGYFVNTTSGAITMTLPSSASIGDTISIKDYAGTFATNNLTIARNSHKIQGETTNSTLSTNRAQVTLVYADATKGWLYTNESNVGEFSPSYVTATGGTVSTTGDYKIHTFNSSSNFVVSDGGNSVGSNKVSYLVIAGGGGGGGDYGGGAGAGGFREGRVSTPDFTASPLVAPDGLTVSAQTYPITVGAGGTGVGPNASPAGSNGSNSVFSTITSTGGGRGGTEAPSTKAGYSGGSGGGSAYAASGGSGNTPPVSPAQGTNGGNGTPSGPTGYAAGGGGGATAAGGPAPAHNVAGAGGAGASTEISGSAVTRAGGGGGAGGGSHHGQSYTQGAGGSGGGGAGTPNPGNTGNNGTANTGSGGGGNNLNPGPQTGGSGGSGVVIVRYKYQN